MLPYSGFLWKEPVFLFVFSLCFQTQRGRFLSHIMNEWFGSISPLSISIHMIGWGWFHDLISKWDMIQYLTYLLILYSPSFGYPSLSHILEISSVCLSGQFQEAVCSWITYELCMFVFIFKGCKKKWHRLHGI